MQASRRPPPEVDAHIAQRYLLKRRLGKGVSRGRTRVFAVPGSKASPGSVSSDTVRTLRLRLASSADWRRGLGEPPSPLEPQFPVTGPTPRKFVRDMALDPGLASSRGPHSPPAPGLCLPVPMLCPGRLGPPAPVAEGGGQEGPERVNFGGHGRGARSMCEPMCICDCE